MDPTVRSHRAVLELNTRLFRNCLDGVDDAAASRRPGEDTNHLAFIALHLLDARTHLARYLGLEVHHPFEADTAGITGIDDLERLPPLADILEAWDRISAALAERLAALGPDDLGRPSEQEFPVEDGSVLGGVAFLLHHESYHVGQMGLLRKYLGRPAMSYD